MTTDLETSTQFQTSLSPSIPHTFTHFSIVLSPSRNLVHCSALAHSHRSLRTTEPPPLPHSPPNHRHCPIRHCEPPLSWVRWSCSWVPFFLWVGVYKCVCQCVTRCLPLRVYVLFLSLCLCVRVCVTRCLFGTKAVNVTLCVCVWLYWCSIIWIYWSQIWLVAGFGLFIGSLSVFMCGVLWCCYGYLVINN